MERRQRWKRGSRDCSERESAPPPARHIAGGRGLPPGSNGERRSRTHAGQRESASRFKRLTSEEVSYMRLERRCGQEGKSRIPASARCAPVGMTPLARSRSLMARCASVGMTPLANKRVKPERCLRHCVSRCTRYRAERRSQKSRRGRPALRKAKSKSRQMPALRKAKSAKEPAGCCRRYERRGQPAGGLHFG